MDTNDPGSLERDMGAIEDRLSEIQEQYASLAGTVKSGEKFLEYYEAHLYELVEGAANPTERKVMAKAMLHDDDQARTHIEKLEQYEQLKAEIAVLDIRRSIGQSLVKLHEQTGFPRHGQAAKGQAGQ